MTIPMEERIRDVAVRVFAQKGFHRTRMKDIAKEAGVAVGSIYNHFRDKDDLLLSIFETEFDARVSFLEAGQRKGLPVIDQVRRLLEEHFALVQKQPELAQLLLLERFNRGGRLRDRFVALQRVIVERIDSILRSGISEGWIRPCNTRVVAQGLFDLVQTMSATGLVYESEEEHEILAAAPAELCDLIWRGLQVSTEEGLA